MLELLDEDELLEELNELLEDEELLNDELLEDEELLNELLEELELLDFHSSVKNSGTSL